MEWPGGAAFGNASFPLGGVDALAFALFRQPRGVHPGAGLTYPVKPEHRSIDSKFLRRHIGRAVRLRCVCLAVVTAANCVETRVRLFPGDDAGRDGFVHSVAHIDSPLAGDILRLHSLRQLIRDDKRDGTLLHHGGDHFLRQVRLSRNRLRTARL